MDILRSSRRGWWRRLAAACLGLVGMQGIGSRQSGERQEALADGRTAAGLKKTPASLDQLEFRQPVSDCLGSGGAGHRIMTFTYDASNRLTSVREGVGTVTTFVYDTRGRWLSTES